MKQPIVAHEHAASLGETLRSLGYSETAVRDLLGDDAYATDRDDAPLGERRLPRTPLATVVRAFFLQLPVAKRDALRALGPRGVDALEATGLAEVEDDELVPHMRILPVGELLVASDDYPSPDEDPPDFVAAYTPTSQLCGSLTPRSRAGRALDVATGSGVLALFAARHSRHVIATDVNARALAYTELNAALNGFDNIEVRRGSLFEPVDGERFDLITCNAPYVVSPESRLTYRDAGLPADEVSRRVVENAAGHLADGGFATLLVSWIAVDEDALDERPLEWTDGIGCDSWILPVWGADPLDHAASWNEPLLGDATRFGETIDTWTRYLERFGTRWVSEGAVLLHRRPGGRYTARVDEIDEDELEDAGAQVERAFAARARLAELARARDLLETRLVVAAQLRLEHVLEPRGGRVGVVEASVQIGEGTQSIVEASPRALEIVASLDGTARLEDAVQAAADRLRLSNAEASRLRRDVLAFCRDLLELGALRFAS